MLFDATVQPLGINIIEPEEDGEDLQVMIVLGMALPFQQGPGQGPIMAPVGNLRVPMGREFALKFADKLKEEGEKLKKPSDIAIAGSLDGIQNLAEHSQKLRG